MAIRIETEIPRRFEAGPTASLDDGGDLFKVYCRDALQEPLLDHEQEIELAKTMEAGREAERRLSEEERELTILQREGLEEDISRGVEARDRLWKANLRLVVSIAKGYLRPGVNYLDLIQEGNIGLMKAIERYDYRRENRFFTYAYYWIEQAVARATDNQTVGESKTSARQGELKRRLPRIIDKFRQKLGREPTLEEISEATGATVEMIEDLRKKNLVSLSSAIGEEGEGELEEVIADSRMTPFDQTAERSLLRDTIASLLKGLDEKERLVLDLRYGFDGKGARTFKEITEELQIHGINGRKGKYTKQNIQILERRVRRKLYTLAVARGVDLKSFVDLLE